MIKPCELKIKKMTIFQIHRWTEAGKKNFKCLVCGLMHSTQNAMYLHTLWKHPEKKFLKCKLCHMYIDATIGQQVHFDEFHKGEISTSLKTRVLKCQICDKIFTGEGRKYSRSQHLKEDHADTAVRCAWFNCCR
jgi:transcription elongation factor Elf1